MLSPLVPFLPSVPVSVLVLVHVPTPSAFIDSSIKRCPALQSVRLRPLCRNCSYCSLNSLFFFFWFPASSVFYFHSPISLPFSS
jgi:hypothetical protein